MATSTRDITKKRKPRPKQTGAPVLVRMQPIPLEALDAVRALVSTDIPRTRPEMVRILLTSWLVENRYLTEDETPGANLLEYRKHRDDPEGAK